MLNVGGDGSFQAAHRAAGDGRGDLCLAEEFLGKSSSVPNFFRV
jgi:hypothetical protein